VDARVKPAHDEIGQNKKPHGETAGLLFETREEDEAFRPWQAWQRPTLPNLEV
jgi:hypothetical protein